MKQINQNKLDKTFQILLLILMDFCAAYALVEQILLINYSHVVKSIPLLIMLLGFLPFVISQHLTNVPKNIENKFIYLMALSGMVMMTFIFLTEFSHDGFMNMGDGIFNLTIGIFGIVIGIVLLIKLLTSEQVSTSNQQ